VSVRRTTAYHVGNTPASSRVGAII